MVNYMLLLAFVQFQLLVIGLHQIGRASYAELGEFERALEISEMAIASAREFQKEDLANRLAGRMKSYQNKKPYRDPQLVTMPGGNTPGE